MFRELQEISERPPVFSHFTTAALWADPYVAGQMLRFHLDESVDTSSRRGTFIEASVAWIVETFGLRPGMRVLDLGCGPGLYTTRFARTGATVTGVDFSPVSIPYAREAAARESLDIEYVQADYLAWEPRTTFDLVTLIFLDYCAMPPDARLALLRKIEGALAPGGAFLFDVETIARFAARTEWAHYTPHPDGGFWTDKPHFEFASSFLYPDESVALEKFTVVEADRTKTIYNWFAHFTPDGLGEELAAAGLEIASVHGDVAGQPYDAGAHEFAVVARRGSSRQS